MTWEPHTFDTAGQGNTCNIWLLRKDLQTDIQILAYPPALLVGMVSPLVPLAYLWLLTTRRKSKRQQQFVQVDAVNF